MRERVLVEPFAELDVVLVNVGTSYTWQERPEVYSGSDIRNGHFSQKNWLDF